MAVTTVPAHTDRDPVDRDGGRPSTERFDVGPLLGRGGMGEVRLARDLRVDREVAIKWLRGQARPEAVARFLREAKVQARLDHPAIVPVYDVGTDDDGVPYFVMKRLTGVTLERVLAAHVEGEHAIASRWPRSQLLARFVDVCLAIELAHTRGVIHRDLKPSNIMLGDFGEVYVLDWGVASIARGADEPAGSGEHFGANTATGALLGTPGYMAPEQIEGAIEERSDVFALGLVLFEILAGRPALPRGNDAFEPTLSVASHRPSSVTHDVPPELDDVCARATANRAADRFPTARALADAVTSYLDGDRHVARRRELVEAHARAAGLAFDLGERPQALREVACALALDPTDHRSLATVRKILFDPPEEVPADVVAKRELERQRDVTNQLAFSQKVYASFLAIVPFAMVSRLQAFAAAGVVATLLIGLIVGAGIARRRPHLIARWLLVVLATHATLITIVGALVGPFQIVPIVTVISMAMLLNHPGTRRFGLVIATHMVIVVVPLCLELAGLTPSSFSIDHGMLSVWLSSGDLGMSEILVAIVITVWVLQLVVAMVLVRNRRLQERARDRLQVHTWQLEQMLPREAGARIGISQPGTLPGSPASLPA